MLGNTRLYDTKRGPQHCVHTPVPIAKYDLACMGGKNEQDPHAKTLSMLWLVQFVGSKEEKTNHEGAIVKHEGLSRHRLISNPLEKQFADEWARANDERTHRDGYLRYKRVSA